MVSHSPHKDASITCWSEQEIKARGFDTPSFIKRMQVRLKKVRGDEDDNDNFLARHNYQKSSRSLV